MIRFVRRSFLLPLAVAIVIPFHSAAWQEGSKTSSQDALVNRYCVGCHSAKLRTAGLILEGHSLDKVAADGELWEKVLRKLEANEMPPSGMPRPPAAEMKAFTTDLEHELDAVAMAHPNPGRPTIHRLNRTEYSNAIRDLFDVDFRAGETLPIDDTGYGFDNIGDVLSLSPVLVERYLAAARMVTHLALGTDLDLQPVVDTFDGLAAVRRSRGGRTMSLNHRISEDLPYDSVGGLSLRYTFPVDAEYVFRIKMSGGSGAFGETAPPVGQILETRAPVKTGVHHVGVTFMRSDALTEPAGGGGGRGGGGGGGAVSGPLSLDLRLDGARLKLYQVTSPVSQGKEIHSFDIAGPYNITAPDDSPSRRRILICKPTSANAEQACARTILSSVAHRAYRRPVTQADIDPLMRFYQNGRNNSSFEAGIEKALRAVLVSPDFLFRIERDPAGAAANSIHRISDLELASRLSFFLWSSIPDDQLLGLAEQGKLKDPSILKRQVSRMLEDQKSAALVDNFSGQWLLLRSLLQVKPDPAVYPEYDDSLRDAIQQETTLFFNAVMRENRPVTELLDAKFTFLNQRLATFYGIPGIYGTRFRRVELADARRGGILGQASVLTVTSYATRTSVVQRGKWILDNLLGSPPPPPPPDVPPLELSGSHGKLSVREAMELHRANPVCASCHAKMDPLGFSLENYDGIGTWRDRDGDAAINASGKLPDGTAFNGADGLRQLLLSNYRDQFISTFTGKLLTYALGRGLEWYDRPGLRSIIRDASKENLTIPALIDAIVRSPQFQMRRSSEL